MPLPSSQISLRDLILAATLFAFGAVVLAICIGIGRQPGDPSFSIKDWIEGSALILIGAGIGAGIGSPFHKKVWGRHYRRNSNRMRRFAWLF